MIHIVTDESFFFFERIQAIRWLEIDAITIHDAMHVPWMFFQLIEMERELG